MKTSMFALAVSLSLTASLSADDHARGLQLLAEGKFAEAAAAFRAAAAAEPTDPRVHYNLALALWRAGDAGAAEIAAEQAATLSDGRLVPLRDGILGNLKMGEAQAKLAGEQPDLQAALGLAKKARDHFLHGAAGAGAPAELTRNLERALQLIAEIEKKVEEQKQQDDQKKDDEKKDDGKDGDKKPGDDKPDDKKPDDEKKDQDKKPDDQKGDEKKDDQQKSDDQKQQGKPEDKPPEPKPEEKPKPEPQQEPKSEQGAPDAKPGEDKEEKPEPKPGADEPQPPPGEQKDAQATPPPEQRELSPEETKRLLDVLQHLQAQQVELEKARAAARPKVKKDW